MQEQMVQQNRTTNFQSWLFTCLKLVVWLSSLLFGLYILLYYGGAYLSNNMEVWNNNLPGLYDPGRKDSTSAIGLHFLAGGIILVLGSIQFIEQLKRAYPIVHRWIGRLYVLSCLIAGLGGLYFIFSKGTIGGRPMDIGFAGYGLLMVLCAYQTIANARKQRFSIHKNWSIRLYSLAIGSWLYRMYYGFWYILTDGLWMEKDFQGPFDAVMSFFFYIPNILLAEIIIRELTLVAKPPISQVISLMLIVSIVLILLGTFVFVKFSWGPAVFKSLLF